MTDREPKTGKTGRLAKGGRPSRYPRWVLVYFLLAAFGGLTVSGSLALHHRLASIHAESVDINRRWVERLEEFQHIGSLIASINAPGNDVFRTGDVAGERARQKAVTGKFQAALARVRVALRVELDEPQAGRLIDYLDSISRATRKMVAESQMVFAYIGTDDFARAGVHMANMDSEYARIIGIMSSLETESHALLQVEFNRQSALTKDIESVQYLIAGLIVLMVAGVATYGYRLSRRMAAQSRQQQAQLRALESSESRYRELTEGSIQGIAVHRNGEPLFVNASWAGMHGFADPDDPEIAKNFNTLVLPENRQEVQETHYALQYGITSSRRYEYRAVRRDGEVIWLECLDRVVVWRNLPAVQSTVIDVTERKNAEKELHAAILRLEQATAARTRFFAAASHDLRQPLHAMSLYLPLLEKRITQPESREIAQAITNSCNSMRELLDSLLDISKLDAGAIDPELVPVSISTILDQLAAEFEPQAREKGLELRVVGTTGLAIETDPILFQRILRNLMSNAIRYTSRGRVLVGIRRRGGNLRIEVRDTGIGIDESNLGLIFQEFYQADNPERDRSRGLGLGLAIIDRLAKLLGHSIDVHSTYGKGSCFAVEAPVATLTTPAGEAVASESEVDISLDGALVVLVDDDDMVLEGTRAVLLEWGCDVIAARSGNGAAARISQRGRAPDIALVDFRLRNNQTAVHALAAIREAASCNVPAIIVTADTDPQRLRQAIDTGCMIVHKPIEPDKLREAMGAAIAGAVNIQKEQLTLASQTT